MMIGGESFQGQTLNKLSVLSSFYTKSHCWKKNCVNILSEVGTTAIAMVTVFGIGEARLSLSSIRAVFSPQSTSICNTDITAAVLTV